MRSCLLFSVLPGVSGSDLPGVFTDYVVTHDALDAISSVVQQDKLQEIVAFHCTLERNVDLILADTFRIPKSKYAQDAGLKFGAGAYLGPNITYCIKEAAGTFAEQYLEAQHPDDPDYDPPEEEFQEARKLILSKLGLPGSGSNYSLGCIRATVDLKRNLNVKGFRPEMRWPLVRKTHGKACRLTGKSNEKFLDKKCSKYKAGRNVTSCFRQFNQSCFDEYTSRNTPEYMHHYGYDTALLYWPNKKNSTNGSDSDSGSNSDGRKMSHFRRRARARARARRGGGSDKSPREVVVFDWVTRVQGSRVPPRKVSKKTLMQHWPTIKENSTDSLVQLQLV